MPFNLRIVGFDVLKKLGMVEASLLKKLLDYAPASDVSEPGHELGAAVQADEISGYC